MVKLSKKKKMKGGTPFMNRIRRRMKSRKGKANFTENLESLNEAVKDAEERKKQAKERQLIEEENETNPYAEISNVIETSDNETEDNVNINPSEPSEPIYATIPKKNIPKIGYPPKLPEKTNVNNLRQFLSNEKERNENVEIKNFKERTKKENEILKVKKAAKEAAAKEAAAKKAAAKKAAAKEAEAKKAEANNAAKEAESKKAEANNAFELLQLIENSNGPNKSNLNKESLDALNLLQQIESNESNKSPSPPPPPPPPPPPSPPPPPQLPSPSQINSKPQRPPLNFLAGIQTRKKVNNTNTSVISTPVILTPEEEEKLRVIKQSKDEQDFLKKNQINLLKLSNRILSSPILSKKPKENKTLEEQKEINNKRVEMEKKEIIVNILSKKHTKKEDITIEEQNQVNEYFENIKKIKEEKKKEEERERQIKEKEEERERQIKEEERKEKMRIKIQQNQNNNERYKILKYREYSNLSNNNKKFLSKKETEEKEKIEKEKIRKQLEEAKKKQNKLVGELRSGIASIGKNSKTKKIKMYEKQLLKEITLKNNNNRNNNEKAIIQNKTNVNLLKDYTDKKIRAQYKHLLRNKNIILPDNFDTMNKDDLTIFLNDNNINIEDIEEEVLNSLIKYDIKSGEINSLTSSNTNTNSLGSQGSRRLGRLRSVSPSYSIKSRSVSPYSKKSRSVSPSPSSNSFNSLSSEKSQYSNSPFGPRLKKTKPFTFSNLESRLGSSNSNTNLSSNEEERIREKRGKKLASRLR